MNLAEDQCAELRALVTCREVPATLATRARIVLWTAEGHRRKDVAELAGVSLPTVDRWVDRYAAEGLAGLDERSHAAPREQVPSWVPARILALTRCTPSTATGLSHWSTREMAAYLKSHEGVSVSWHYVAKLWRDNDLKPHRQGTFKASTVRGEPQSKDPAFAAEVYDIVGLYVALPGGRWCYRSMRRPRSKRWTAPSRCCHWTSGSPRKARHDYKRHGTTNLFTALNTATGQVLADCYPRRQARFPGLHKGRP